MDVGSLASVSDLLLAATHAVAATVQTGGDAAAAVAASDAGGIHAFIERNLAYGPWFVFIILVLSGVGLHISEDFILIPAGFLIARGEKLPMWETFFAAYFGLIIGDMLWVAMCRRFGTRMVQSKWFKRIVHPRRLLEAKHQMEQRGLIVVVLARFIPGTRTPVITMAGILHMPWWKLIPVECATVLITVPLQMGIGYLAGRGYENAESTGERILWVAALVAVTLALIFGVHWWMQARGQAGPAPRSRASWLRTFARRKKVAAPPTEQPPAAPPSSAAPPL